MFYKLLNKKEIKILSYRFFLSMRVVYAVFQLFVQKRKILLVENTHSC